MRDGVKTGLNPRVSEDARVLTSGIPSPKRGAWISSAALVGRDAVLAALAETERSCTVIFGEPGIGKTRLLAEARRRGLADTHNVACVPTSTPIPFDPLIALLHLLHRAARVPRTQLEALLGSSESDWLLYFRDALGVAAAEAPLTIQIDDVHLADEKTLEAIRYCATRLCDLPIHWQLAARRSNPSVIDLASALERAELGRVINLGGLSSDDLRLLVTRLRPEADFGDLEIAELCRRTGGNPLYAELLVVAPMLGNGSASSDLGQVLRQRITALSREAFAVASWLSVNIDALSNTDLSILARRSPGRITHATAELVNEAILEEIDGRYQFRHDLLREACYSMLNEQERIEMHAVLADRCKNDWKRAAHLDGACRFFEAASLFNKIGWESLERHAPLEALQAFESAFERSELGSQIEVEASAGKATALLALGRSSEAKATITPFETLALRLSPSVRARVRTLYAETIWDATDDDAVALPLAQEAIGEARAVAPDLLPRLHYLLGSIEERRGNLDTAKEILEQGVALCHEPQDRRSLIRLIGWLGVVVARTGKVHESLESLEAAARRATAWHLSDELARCCSILCYVSHMAGDKERYEHWCRVGLDASGPKSKAIEAALRSNLASVAIDRGDLREALGLALTAESSIAANKLTLRSRLLCLQIQLYAMLGDFESARRVLDDGRLLDLSTTARQAVAFSAGFSAELHGHYGEALTRYTEVVSGLAPSDFCEVYHVRALAGIVRLAAQLGEIEASESALEHLRTVATRGWPIAQRSLLEAEGCLALSRGDSRGADQLLQAARDCEYPFWRAHLELIVAQATGDRQLFLDAIETFDAMGAEFAADRARALARAHGLRPGRKREAHGALSSREASVAFLIASGKTNAEIGEILHISSRTVEYHVGNILGKCGLRSRVEIAATLAAGRPLGAQAESLTS